MAFGWWRPRARTEEDLGFKGWGAAGAGPIGPKRPGTYAGGTHGMPCARALIEFVGVPV
jgi:hypothetical protein